MKSLSALQMLIYIYILTILINEYECRLSDRRKLIWMDGWNDGNSLLGQSTLHTSTQGSAGLTIGDNSRNVNGQMQQLINDNCIGQQSMLGTQKQNSNKQNQKINSMQQKVCLDGSIQQDFGNQKQQQKKEGIQQQLHKQELDLGTHKLTQLGAQQQAKGGMGHGQQQQGLLQGVTEKENNKYNKYDNKYDKYNNKYNNIHNNNMNNNRNNNNNDFNNKNGYNINPYRANLNNKYNNNNRNNDNFNNNKYNNFDNKYNTLNVDKINGNMKNNFCIS